MAAFLGPYIPIIALYRRDTYVATVRVCVRDLYTCIIICEERPYVSIVTVCG